MNNYVALIRRELSVYFVSPMAYVVLTAFLVASGLFYREIMDTFAQNRAAMDFGTVQLIMVNLLTLMAPLITMRLVAEEKTRGTMETMMTAPVSEWQFVLSKFTAAFLFVCYLLLPTVCYALLGAKFGSVDAGAVAAGYFGMLLAMLAVLSVGLCISALSPTQITAGVLTLIASLSLMLLPMLARRIPEDVPFARETLGHLNLLGHMETFVRGIVDVPSAVYLLSVSFLFLFVTVRVVESRRWR